MSRPHPVLLAPVILLPRMQGLNRLTEKSNHGFGAEKGTCRVFNPSSFKDDAALYVAGWSGRSQSFGLLEC